MSPMRLGDPGAPIHVHSPMTPVFSYPSGGGLSSPAADKTHSPDTLDMPPFNHHHQHRPPNVSIKRLSTGPHPLLPRELVSDIQQFSQSDFAKKYFATHREGIFFRRRVPLEKMMSWQKVKGQKMYFVLADFL